MMNRLPSAAFLTALSFLMTLALPTADLAASRLRAEESNFLARPMVSVVRHSPFARGNWADLVDNDPNTRCQLRCQDGVAELVVQLSDIGAVQGWRVVTRSSKPIRAELLGSAISDKAGFSLLRSDMVSAKSAGKKLAFRPQGVKFLMLRFSGDANTDTVEVADIFVIGEAGPPATKYEFTESPAKALDVLSKLQQSDELKIVISADESSLFADARDGRLDEWSLAEAALLASGVTAKEKREKLLKQIDDLASQAKQATQQAKDDFQRGDLLLHWLHRKDGPLAGGYVSQQTRLDVLLAEKKFNCVSSAVIFNILASRLGIDARAIEVPDHAFSIVYQGAKHADVETTNAVGFNPARDRAAQREFEKQTGLRYIPDSHRDKRREISDAGLVAIIYYNRGVTLTDRKQHHQALFAYFRAMSMDKEFNSAIKNALAGMVNWGNELLDQGQFEQSTRVIATGLALAPNDASLQHNQEVAYGKWALALADTQKHDQAVSVLRRAAKLMPKRDFVDLQAGIFARQGELQIEDGRWQDALTTAETAIQKVDQSARPKVIEWRQGVLLRWANERLEDEDFGKAVDLLAQCLEHDAKDRRASNNLAFTIQQWAAQVQNKQGGKPARDLLLNQVQRFPARSEVSKVAANFARNSYVALRDQNKFSEAIQSIEDNQGLIDSKEAKRLHVDAYQVWSGQHIRGKRWKEAVDALEAGLTTFPQESRFEQNLAYCVQNWAVESHRSENTKQTRQLLLQLQKRFPKRTRVAKALEAFLHSLVAEAFKGPNASTAAWKILDSYQGVLKPEREINLGRIIADQTASKLRKAGKWQAALGVYDEGLKRYPDDRHMRNNSIATWHAWAKPAIKAENWAQAIQVYENALKRFPNEGSFKQNVEYCRHKANPQ